MAAKRTRVTQQEKEKMWQLYQAGNTFAKIAKKMQMVNPKGPMGWVAGGDLRQVLLWGFAMFAAAIVCRQLNVSANKRAIENAHFVSFEVRQDLFFYLCTQSLFSRKKRQPHDGMVVSNVSL